MSACCALAGARRDAGGEALLALVSRWLGGWSSRIPPAPTSPADVTEPGEPDPPDPPDPPAPRSA